MAQRLVLVASVMSAFMLAGPAAQARPATGLPAGTPAGLTVRTDGMDIRTGNLLVRVTALTDTTVRVRIAPGGVLPEDASWAVPAEARARRVAVRQLEDGFATTALRVRDVAGRLRIEDVAGRVISADAIRPATYEGRSFTLRKTLDAQEHIFGLGDKTGSDLDRRGMTYVDWNTDTFAFTSSQDPIYKSIPFFMSVGGAGGAYGILFDNTWRSFFDFGHRDPDTVEFGAPDGPGDYYVIAGPSPADVVRRYTDLTGKAPLPPLWSLGFQQSRYSYMDADEVRQVATHLRNDHVPVDAIWLDIDYQDRNRPFTVNRRAFPDLAGLSAEMKAKGIRLVGITDLHVAAVQGEGYAPYETGLAQNRFVHNADGSVYVGQVWPGPSVFPDFSDAGARTWWGELFKEPIAAGLAGAWNDMNEPSVFQTVSKTMPLDVVHRIAGDDFTPRAASHAEIHNVYGLLNTRATYDGLRALMPDERAYVMTRATYAGGQRYAVTWTGDNSSTWDHLRLAVHQVVNLGLSGFSWSGADVGGFTGGPSADLLTRWFEIGAFLPVFRDHAAKDTPRAEPWVDGPMHLAIRRRFVEERYRLLPYLYALADENSRTGDPIVRPVFYDHPAAINATCDQAMTFAVGKGLIVAPPPRMESPQGYDICLPADSAWFDYWTGLPVNGPKQAISNEPVQSATQMALKPVSASLKLGEVPRLDRLPVYVRAGTILPRQPLVQNTAQTPDGPLQIDVYPGQDCAGSIYLDDGHSMAFQRGDFLRQAMRCAYVGNELQLTFDRREGTFQPWWKRMRVAVHGLTGRMEVVVGTARVAGAHDDAARTMTFDLDDPRDGTVVRLIAGRS